jgi:predicted transposase YdaD
VSVSFPFDATLKDIVQDHAADYAGVFGLPKHGPVTPLNVDLSTLSAATDVALGYGEPLREIVDMNFQSGADPKLDRRVHLYNAAFGHHFEVPVQSVVVLLRPAADHPNLTGKLRYGRGPTRVQFNYKVIRLWQQPVKPFLRGGLGVLPLALLCALPPNQPTEQALADVVRRMYRRLQAETDNAQVRRLMAGAYVLSGLRVPYATADNIFRGVTSMEESSTYQHILELGRQEGEVRHAQRGLIRLGRQKFGRPRAADERAVLAIADLARLDRMTDAILTAASWGELLATP